jgi:transposase InsO family protein
MSVALFCLPRNSVRFTCNVVLRIRLAPAAVLQLGNKRYCYPLTVTDYTSRYLLLCEAMESNQEQPAFQAFERLFRERGLPKAIRSDNGVPFASPNGLFNLSKLSVWWLRLGISIERIRPGHPQQNGRHERMHLTLKSVSLAGQAVASKKSMTASGSSAL